MISLLNFYTVFARSNHESEMFDVAVLMICESLAELDREAL